MSDYRAGDTDRLPRWCLRLLGDRDYRLREERRPVDTLAFWSVQEGAIWDGLFIVRPGELEHELLLGITGAEWAAGDGEDRIAFGGGGGAAVVNTATGQVDILDGVGAVSSLGFIRDGELLILASRDGTVRLWDLERAAFAGELWDGDGTALGNPWYDEATDSVWIATSGSAVRLPLSPQRSIERACELLGRELTVEEWAEYVPGDAAQQPVCTAT